MPAARSDGASRPDARQPAHLGASRPYSVAATASARMGDAIGEERLCATRAFTRREGSRSFHEAPPAAPPPDAAHRDRRGFAPAQPASPEHGWRFAQPDPQ